MKKLITLIAALLISPACLATNLHFSLVYASGPALLVSGSGTYGNLYIDGKKNVTVSMPRRGTINLTATTTANVARGFIYILDQQGQSCTLQYTNGWGQPALKLVRHSWRHHCHVHGRLIQVG